MRRVLDGFEQRAEKVVGWFDDRQIGGAVRFGLTLYTLAIPVFQNFQITTEKGWLWSWVVAVMLLIPFQRYQAGSYARRLARQIASINGSLAGSIEDIGRMLDGGKRLQEGQCNKVSTALLHRIKDFASLALNILFKRQYWLIRCE